MVPTIYLFIGYCCIVYLPCSDANSFAFNSATNADLDDSAVSNECTGDYLVLEGMKSFLLLLS